ncbi:MAG: GAK system CofD-like protein [Desulfonatronovibrio sp.]
MPIQKIKLSRGVNIPDQLRLSRYAKTPELGPRILFFSGGTALNPLSKAIVKYTHNSIHIVTPFDSGGSSAKLRQTFNMPAVGDMRSRLMALADQSVKGNPEIRELFAYRLPKDQEKDILLKKLESMATGKNSLIRKVHDPMRKIIRNHLSLFIKKMPADFDLKGASIGNLILASGYFANDRHIDPVIFIFSKLAEVRGTVRPVVNNPLHLIARLEDKSLVKGQHMLTGKETTPIQSRVSEFFLSKSLDKPEPHIIKIKNKIKRLIQNAELICYPMGSFYSSIIANILPQGIGSSIAENLCPKIFIPNTGFDPEQTGTSLDQRVEILLSYLKKSCLKDEPASKLLDLVLLDNEHSLYQGGVNIEKIKKMGIEVLQMPLTIKEQKPYLNNQLLVEAIASIA